MAEPLSWRAGGCHCGAVRFEAALPAVVEAQSCNCSICARTGFVHVIVPQSRFRVLSGQSQLTEYTFNTGVAKHLFCKVCGIKSFYRPRSNPDGWSVNARCLDDARRQRRRACACGRRLAGIGRYLPCRAYRSGVRTDVSGKPALNRRSPPTHNLRHCSRRVLLR